MANAPILGLDGKPVAQEFKEAEFDAKGFRPILIILEHKDKPNQFMAIPKIKALLDPNNMLNVLTGMTESMKANVISDGVFQQVMSAMLNMAQSEQQKAEIQAVMQDMKKKGN